MNQDNKRRSDMTRRGFIQTAAFGLAPLTLGTGPLLLGTGRGRADFDVLVRGGLVFDGHGGAPVEADVGIRADRIVEIGRLSGRTAEVEIPAAGYAVAPGFIDIHSHTDYGLLIDPKAQSKIRQGVTTEVLGQDGGSVAPLKEADRRRRDERYRAEYGVAIDWTDFTGFHRRLQKSGSAVNWLTMLGQGTLRGYVVGLDDRAATREEIQEMRRLAELYIGQGVWGISSGLEYTPGSYASTDEIAEICSVFRGRAGIYATHMRNEDDYVEDAVREAIDIARRAGVRLQVSHLKAQGKRNWHRAPKLLAMLEDAQNAGLDVAADRYPYEAYSTGLSSLFPLWSRDGGTSRFLQRLQDPGMLSRIRRDVEDKIARLGDWHAVMVSSVSLPENEWMLGLRMPDIAKRQDKTAFVCTRDLIVAEKSRVGMCGFGMSEENTQMILKHPLVAIDSDGSARSTEGPLSSGHPHPRNFGTFPRVLGKYARDLKLFPLQEAVRKMTTLPAQILGLRDRGTVAVGAYADLVVFDPDRVADRATFAAPKQYPVGIDYVLVNGRLVVDQGEHTGRLPGQVLIKK